MKKPSTERMWHVGYPWLGGTLAGLAAWRFGAADRVFQSETVETAVLGGLIALSGLIISVLLALLGLLVALDHREIVRVIRTKGLYKDLIKMAFQPLVIFMILALGSVVGLLTNKTDAGVARAAISIGALVAMSSGLLATLRFAIQLTSIMLDESAADNDDGTSELAAARRRAAGTASEDPPAPPTSFEGMAPTPG